MKIRRNEKCPCGSGFKYKKCHGSPIVHTETIVSIKDRLLTIEIQRRRQQGFGKAIISHWFNGEQWIAVGNRLYHSANWKTFHDFLFDYPIFIFGIDWFRSGREKARSEIHPLISWRSSLVSHLQPIEKDGEIITTETTTEISSFLTLSYYLYLIAHNAKLETLLILRLKNKEQFAPAYYEAFVFSTMIMAGFEIEVEDESDPCGTHPEFWAVSKKTKKRYSVEAKRRQFGKDNASVWSQLKKALSKDSPCERIIFIELSLSETDFNKALKTVQKETIAEIRSLEDTLQIKGEPAPPAYVIITNKIAYIESGLGTSEIVFAEGFKISDLKYDKGMELHSALLSREKHIDIFDLIDSMREHTEIPSTFYGDISELDNNPGLTRLLIGKNYLIPNTDGQEVVGLLESGCVVEQEQRAYGIYRLKDGKRIICSSSLSDDELKAYRRYPDTFFGKPEEKQKQIHDIVDAYDFLYRTYGYSSRVSLLEFMKDYPDFDNLGTKTQEELAIIYCERMAQTIIVNKNI
jgi:hypothetical protein